jgi:hypothetical protein
MSYDANEIKAQKFLDSDSGLAIMGRVLYAVRSMFGTKGRFNNVHPRNDEESLLRCR